MKKVVYRPHGVCSTQIAVTVEEDGKISDVIFTGGCSGNTQGVAKLAVGRNAEEVIALCEGIRCGRKPTSCPAQMALALREALENGG